jgi:small-conductance mechanosensitive channel
MEPRTLRDHAARVGCPLDTAAALRQAADELVRTRRELADALAQVGRYEHAVEVLAGQAEAAWDQVRKIKKCNNENEGGL